MLPEPTKPVPVRAIATLAAGALIIASAPTKPTDHDGVTRAYLTTVIANQQAIIDRLEEVRELVEPPPPPPPIN